MPLKPIYTQENYLNALSALIEDNTSPPQDLLDAAEKVIQLYEDKIMETQRNCPDCQYCNCAEAVLARKTIDSSLLLKLVTKTYGPTIRSLVILLAQASIFSSKIS